jgi:hypothetical protein
LEYSTDTCHASEEHAIYEYNLIVIIIIIMMMMMMLPLTMMPDGDTTRYLILEELDGTPLQKSSAGNRLKKFFTHAELDDTLEQMLTLFLLNLSPMNLMSRMGPRDAHSYCHLGI